MKKMFIDKWWFYVLLIVVQQLPPIATRNFDIAKWSDIIGTTLSNSFQTKMSSIYPYAQLLTFVVLLLLFVYKNRFGKIFSLFAGGCFAVHAFIQNIAITPEYGWSIVSVNVVMFLGVAATWFYEARVRQNDYRFGNIRLSNAWLIIGAIVSLWLPISNGGFDFNPTLFLSNGSSTAFCMMTPIFLTIMTFNLPRINPITYRVTAAIGLILGLYNMMNFGNVHTHFLGYIHLPLLITSAYCLVLSYRYAKEIKQQLSTR